MKLKIGDKAPVFKLSNQYGKEVKLSDFKGKNVLIYFYPKDSTPGCTKEACTLKGSIKDFGKLDTVILGISCDSVKSHKRFSEKYDLPFDILSDENKEVVKKYGVWQKKKLAGREYMGIVRSSFLVGGKGEIISLYDKVKPDKHAGEVLEDLKEVN